MQKDRIWMFRQHQQKGNIFIRPHVRIKTSQLSWVYEQSSWRNEVLGQRAPTHHHFQQGLWGQDQCFIRKTAWEQHGGDFLGKNWRHQIQRKEFQPESEQQGKIVQKDIDNDWRRIWWFRRVLWGKCAVFWLKSFGIVIGQYQRAGVHAENGRENIRAAWTLLDQLVRLFDA